MKSRISYPPYGDGPCRYEIEGVEVTEQEYRERTGSRLVLDGAPPSCPGTANWPILSDAMGVHPDQIPEAIAHAAKHGIRLEFTDDGRAIVRSPVHRKQLGELYGLYDRNGGYGDPQRRHAIQDDEPAPCPDQSDRELASATRQLLLRLGMVQER